MQRCQRIAVSAGLTIADDTLQRGFTTVLLAQIARAPSCKPRRLIIFGYSVTSRLGAIFQHMAAPTPPFDVAPVTGGRNPE
jgi:chorismate mutase